LLKENHREATEKPSSTGIQSARTTNPHYEGVCHAIKGMTRKTAPSLERPKAESTDCMKSCPTIFLYLVESNHASRNPLFFSRYSVLLEKTAYLSKFHTICTIILPITEHDSRKVAIFPILMTLKRHK
jgi:hypothetical protein